MNDLSIPELLEGSRDLLDRRAAALSQIPTGDYFARVVREKTDTLAALPDAVRTLPLADLLRLLDKDHDQWGRSIHYLMRAVEEMPTAPKALQDVATLVRDRYMTGLQETRLPYGVAAQQGHERGARLPGDEAAMSAVGTPDQRNLFAWVGDYVAAAKAVGGALSGRADKLSSSGDASNAARLRSELIATFGELRAAIQLQLKAQPSLARTLESDVLGKLDELQRLAFQRRKKAAEDGDPKPA